MKKIIYYISVVSIVFLSFYLNYYYKIKIYVPQEDSAYSTGLHKNLVGLKDNTASDMLELYANGAVLIDADTNRILYSKNADKEMPMASTTKIMTCICALENANLDDTVTVSQKAASQPKVHLGVSEGEKYLLRDLLYSLMLESHNDSAVAIAEYVSGSVENFAKLMNQKARDLGCYNTYFITPNGLDSTVTLEDGSTKVHHTTAEELALIMNYCVHTSPQKDAFLEITRAKNYSFCDVEGKHNFSVANHNAALESIPGALSGKTGFTNEAGYCYVGAFEEGEHKFILALLACGWPNNRTYKWSDCRTLLNYGKEKYSYNVKDINDISLEFPEIKIYNGAGFTDEMKNLPIYLKNEDEFSVLESVDDGENITYYLPEAVEAPIEKDTEVGILFFNINDTVIKSFPIYAAETIRKPDIKSYLDDIVTLFLQMAI